MALSLHDMLSERVGFGFEEKSMFKQKAAHAAIWFISQDRFIWQCVLRDTFSPLAIWGMVFTQVWNYCQCNNFFSTFLMGAESYFYSYLWGLLESNLPLQVKISLFLGCCFCVWCTDISKLLYPFMLSQVLLNLFHVKSIPGRFQGQIGWGTWATWSSGWHPYPWQRGWY